jgi:hypothetical protein
MSTVLLLTPVVIASWPAIVGAVTGAAAAMGLAVSRRSAGAGVKVEAATQVEVELEDSAALNENTPQDEAIVLERDGIQLTVSRNARGRYRVCAAGKGHSKAELRAVAEEFSRRMTQCFIYNRMVTELRDKGFRVVSEEQLEDQSVRIHVRRWEE